MEFNELPDINQLKTVAASATVPLSLRVKESTKALFDIEAEKAHLSTNALINTLLDTYADRCIASTMTERESKMQILRRHLETTAKKASSLDSETLLREIIELYHPMALFEGVNSASTDMLIRDCAMWSEGRLTHFFEREHPYFFTMDGVVTAVHLKKPASIEVEYDDLIDTPCIDCYIRIDYWIALMAILMAYENKLVELFPDQTAYLGEQVYRIIAQCANVANDRAEFAQLTAQAIIKSLESRQPKSSKQVHRRKDATEPTMAELLVIALEELHGTAKLVSIYEVAERLSKQYRKNSHYKDTKTFQAVVRGTLERCSKDCNPDTKQDYFHNPSKGDGYWHLNPGVHYDHELKKVTTRF